MEKHISKIILLFFLSFVYNSCKTIEYNRYGVDGYVLLNLNKDSSFYEINKSLTGVDSIYGNWIRKKDTIYLDINNSEVFFIENTKGFVTEKHYGNNDSIYFSIKIKDSNINLSSLCFNHNYYESFSTDENGNLRVSKKNIKFFYVFSKRCFAGINHKIQDTTANYFEIEMTCQFDWFSTQNVIINPVVKYVKSSFKLIPIMYGNKRNEFALKRKLLKK